MGSERKLAIARELVAAYRAADIERYVALLDPDVELRPAVVGAPEHRVFSGHDGVRRWFAEAAELFSYVQLEGVEVEDAGGDVVLGIGELVAVGRESGAEIRSPTAWIVTVRDGAVTRMHGYLSVEEARAALETERAGSA